MGNVQLGISDDENIYEEPQVVKIKQVRRLKKN
jgi:hypothetical protein